MKAKSVSLWVIVLAGVWVAALSLVRAVFPAMTGAELGLGVPEIIATGGFFVVIFTPVYRSIWLDKKLGAQVELAEASGSSADKLTGLLAAIEGIAGTAGGRTQDEPADGPQGQEPPGKDNPSGQEPPAAGVAAGA